jgi:phage/plasmid-like protein (TIGR03299 family)
MVAALAKSYATGKYRMAYRKRSNKDKPWHDSWTHCMAWITDPDLPTVLHDLEAYVEVITRPIFDSKGKVIPELRETWRPHCDTEGNALIDDFGNPLGVRLGLVGPQYTLVQDSEVVNWFEPWVESGTVTIETGGAIFGGSKFWILARINKDSSDITADDPVHQFILVMNGHDGRVSFTALPTIIRVVCSNTLEVAVKSALIRYKARHSKLVHAKISEIQSDIEALDEEFQDSVAKFKALAASNVANEKELKAYFQKVLGEKLDPDKVVKADGKRPLAILMRLFEEGETLQAKGVKNTWWSAFNCVTEYVTHLRGRNSDMRLDNMISGIGVSLNDRALKIGLQAADGMLNQI